MSLLEDTLVWLKDGAHYRGADGVPHRLLEHLWISGASVALAAAVAFPLAIWLGHSRRVPRLGAAVLLLSNASRAVPVFAVLVMLAATPVGFGNRATVVALTLFALPPLLTNTFVGVRGVDRDVVEAARGNGMSGLQVLRGVELPLALPLIAAGVRTAVVQVVATATLAAYVGGGGLGRFIADGFGRADPAQTAAGGLLVAALALLLELSLGLVQRRLTPSTETRP
jgi:osmoprotectant transport system permease protein